MYDSIIIGFGKGGKTLAGALAKRGENVALIEKSENMYGGTCINVGCIPSKSLVNSGRLAKAAQYSSFHEKAEAYRLAITEKRRLTSMLRKKNFDKLNNLSNVTVINGNASFVSGTELLITGSGKSETVEGKKIFINTGSTPVMPPIKGIDKSNVVYTSETLMELDKLPKKLVIIGGGYIGLEFASMYASFGSEVTVIQDSDIFIPREDRDIADAILRTLSENGVNFILSAKISEIDGGSLLYTCGDEFREITADAILVATGRKPNTAELNTSNAGIELTPRGAVKVDEHLKTTANNIWAMGDVTGGLAFTYISLDDYRIVLSDIYGDSSRNTQNRGNVAYSVFITPPFSRIGLNEKEALEKGFDIKVAKLPAAAIPKAQVLNETHGFLKAIIDEKTDLILGAMLFCEESYEMINLLKLAMDSKIPYTVLRDNIYTHPTMTEAFNDLFSL